MGMFSKKKKLPHIYLGFPLREGLMPAAVGFLHNVILTNGQRYTFDYSLNTMGSVAMSRDHLARMMLDVKKAKGILMIDGDMKPTPAQAERILSHNLPIVGGTYSRKEPVCRWVMQGIRGEEVNEFGLLKVKEIGTGFLWIAREVFEKMIQEMPEIEYPATDAMGVMRPMWNFFFQGVVEQENQEGKMARRFLGEDYGFCHFARKLGYDIYADTTVIIPHTGLVDYPLPAERKTDAQEKSA